VWYVKAHLVVHRVGDVAPGERTERLPVRASLVTEIAKNASSDLLLRITGVQVAAEGDWP